MWQFRTLLGSHHAMPSPPKRAKESATFNLISSNISKWIQLDREHSLQCIHLTKPRMQELVVIPAQKHWVNILFNIVEILFKIFFYRFNSTILSRCYYLVSRMRLSHYFRLVSLEANAFWIWDGQNEVNWE